MHTHTHTYIMNSGDLQYASGSVAIAGNLFVGGTVTSSGTVGSGVTSVTAAAGQTVIGCAPTTGAVVISYTAPTLGGLPSSGVPVSSVYTPDTAVFPAVGAAPISGNLLITGGQVLLGGTLPRGAIVCSSSAGTTLPGAPTNVGGTLEFTNVGIAGVVADSKSFTGTTATDINPALPGTVEFTSPYPGMTVRSSYLEGNKGSGTVEVSNVGVTSLAIKDAMALPLVGDIQLSSGGGISLQYMPSSLSTVPYGNWNYLELYEQNVYVFNTPDAGWYKCLIRNQNNKPPIYPQPNTQYWGLAPFWSPTVQYSAGDIVQREGDLTHPTSLYAAVSSNINVDPFNGSSAWSLIGLPGTPSTSQQIIQITNSGVTSTVAGTGISVTGGPHGDVTVANTGVLSYQSISGSPPTSGSKLYGDMLLSAAPGSGMAILTGSVGSVDLCAFQNTGVLSASASGAGIAVTTSVDPSGGQAVTISNTGVLSVVPSVVVGQEGISCSAASPGVISVGYSLPLRTHLTNSLVLGGGSGSYADPFYPVVVFQYYIGSGTTFVTPIQYAMGIDALNNPQQLGYLSSGPLMVGVPALTPFAIFVGVSTDAIKTSAYSVMQLTDTLQLTSYPATVQLVQMRQGSAVGDPIVWAFVITPTDTTTTSYTGAYTICC